MNLSEREDRMKALAKSFCIGCVGGLIGAIFGGGGILVGFILVGGISLPFTFNEY